MTSDPHFTVPIRLCDYRPPAYLADSLELDFQLDREKTRVVSKACYRRNPAAAQAVPFRLDGRQLTLSTITLDRVRLTDRDYKLDATGLTIPRVPDEFTLTVTTIIDPAANTVLEGLYASGRMLCTQCEAHGFSRITYFPDRPDILTRITTRLEADRASYPVLLSNGNLVASGELPGGRHFAHWRDPFPKPVYLFALVAGDLVRLEDEFTTASGRRVAIHFYVEEPNRHKCGHAMAALKRAMAWDEREYGREYDLNLYQVVAVDDFNFGAMENKGLNIFNAKYVLAEAESATDADFEAVESVIAHEYFHNWTGNRITCRDWFQLSLKEGLTVFRDQQYSETVFPGGGRRIRQVRRLRNFQFPEDQGPLAHPVQPREYTEINNFYTTTIYEKGAEIIRMLCTRLGRERFRQGMELYFSRFDGQAVTIDDLLSALSEGGGIDLSPFKLWYEQAGTPRLEARREWRSERRELILKIDQQTPPTPGQPEKRPLPIPVALALLGQQGQELRSETPLLENAHAEFSFRLPQCEKPPLVSLLRGFSAPVELANDFSDEELARLLEIDNDPFSRWEAGQKLALKAICNRLDAPERPNPALELYSAALGRLLRERWPAAAADGIAELLLPPDEIYIGGQRPSIDPAAIHRARQELCRVIARRWRKELEESYIFYREQTRGPYRPEPGMMALRRLQNIALDYLARLGAEGPAAAFARRQYAEADNLTQRLAALAVRLQLTPVKEWEGLPEMADFYRRGAGNPLLRDRWFALQANADRPETLERVAELLQHPEYKRTNPNRVRALLGTLTLLNPAAFHRADGAGYRLLGQEISELDKLNPQVAARLAGALSRWPHYASPWRELMRTELEKLAAGSPSPDLGDILQRSLARA